MLSPAARKFSSAVPTPAAFRQLAKAEPHLAATWLVRFADCAGLTGGAIDQLKALEQKKFQSEPKRAAAFEAFFNDNAKLADMVDLANVQTARATTLGFTVVDPGAAKKPALLTGTVKMTGGVLQLEVAGKTYKVDSANWQASLQFEYFEANALGAFDGKTVTVKAYPTGTDDLIAVEEFSPGVGTDFVSGRLQQQGDKMGVRVRPDKWVEIADPTLQKTLRGLPKLGVILPGKVVQEGDKFVLKGKPKDYWMLCANAQFGQAAVPGTVAMAHGQSHAVKGDISTPQATRRLLILGHIADDASTVVAKKALATPEVKFENGVPFTPDAKALAPLVPVELSATEPDGFEC